MPKTAEEIELRSEEVQEILGTPPNWMVRWGTSIAFVTLVVLAWVSFWVRYPDTISGEVRVTSTDPPKKIISENNAMISEIRVQHEDTVKAGQVLLVFNSRAKLEDIQELENRITAVDAQDEESLLGFAPSQNLELGELENDLYNFFKKQEEFAISNSRQYERLSIRQLRRQIKSLESRYRVDQKRKIKLEEQLALVNQRYSREQNLYAEKVISLTALRRTREEILTLERELQEIEGDVKKTDFEIQAIRNQISGVQRGSDASQSNASIELKEQFIELRNKVNDWKKRYLITAPISGIASFTNENIGEQQFVLAETEIMEVVPIKKTMITGRVMLGINGSGKVKLGQSVIVKFDSYPFAEFGAVLGRVAKKGNVPVGEKIPIEISFQEDESFSKGLQTTTGQVIEVSREMAGTAEIVTADKRLIERVFERFRRITT